MFLAIYRLHVHMYFDFFFVENIAPVADTALNNNLTN